MKIYFIFLHVVFRYQIAPIEKINFTKSYLLCHKIFNSLSAFTIWKN